MDLLFIKIKLKEKVQIKDVFNLVEEWLIGSPHYNIDKIEYNQEQEYEQVFDNSRINIISQEIEGANIFAFRFSHTDNDQIWETDCIFNNNDKSFSVRLSCVSKSYSSFLPRIHKPQIIKQLFEMNMVDSKSTLPTTDTAMFVDNNEENIGLCSQIINGELITELPVVYISYDTFCQDHYYVDPNSLAVKLSGQAHVIVEPCREFALALKEKTNGKNVYWGFIGVYFPGRNCPVTFSPFQYISDGKIDKTKLSNAIRLTVQQATLNHYSTNDLTWEKLLLEINKKRVFEQKGEVEISKSELEKYMSNFDKENDKLKEEVKRLRKEIDIQSNQLESYKKRYESAESIVLTTDYSKQFYAHEYYDFIINILQLSNKHITEGNRGKEIMSSILENNKSSGTCKAKMENIKNALREKSVEKKRSALERCGFIIEKGAHDKLVFYDSRYTFSLSNSPSDYRESENLYSDMAKRIDVTKKYF